MDDEWKMVLNQEIEPGALYTRRAPLPFGKEKRFSAPSGAVLHPAVLCPTPPASKASLPGLISPRIKWGSCPLHLSPFTCWGTGHYLTIARMPRELQATQVGSTWCHRRSGGEAFWGPRAVMPSHLNQQHKGGCAFSVICVLIVQLRGYKKGWFIPLFL